ncbi:hypothetical protein TBR22_A10750 [Luteitalea sp. TBR-22]|nr:hypothetical protein TBR22_A10750 [Luteitalea sp. TBR-22]
MPCAEWRRAVAMAIRNSKSEILGLGPSAARHAGPEGRLGEASTSVSRGSLTVDLRVDGHEPGMAVVVCRTLGPSEAKPEAAMPSSNSAERVGVELAGTSRRRTATQLGAVQRSGEVVAVREPLRASEATPRSRPASESPAQRECGIRTSASGSAQW